MGQRRALRDLLRELILGPSGSEVEPPAGSPAPARRVVDPKWKVPPTAPRSGSAPTRKVNTQIPAPPVPRAPRPSIRTEGGAERVWAGQGSQDAQADEAEARTYLERIREKMERTALDFARGLLNRAQFEELYAHYQKERSSVERFLEMFPHSDAWRSVVTEGFSMAIRRRHQAKVIAYAIYHNETSLPLYIHGNFRMESELVVGMLSGFRTASAEIFGAGLRQTEVEDGKSLYFLPGRYTTLIALYSSQPSPVQLKALEDVHRDFETANAEALARSSPQPDQLVFPHRPVLE